MTLRRPCLAPIPRSNRSVDSDTLRQGAAQCCGKSGTVRPLAATCRSPSRYTWSCSFVLVASLGSVSSDFIGSSSARLRAAPRRVGIGSSGWLASVGVCCAACNLMHWAAVKAAPQASALRRHSLPGLAAAVSRLPGNAQLSVSRGFGTIRGCITIRSSRNRFAVRLNSSVRQHPPQQGGFMFKTLLVSFVLAAVSFSSFAETRCRTDSFGNTTCRDSDGNTTRGRTDSFGNTTWRDDSGNTVRSRTDSFGNTTSRDDNGNTVRSRTDSFGNTTYRDDSGNTVRSRTDSFGNTTFRDDNGNTVKCRTDSFGNTTCR